MTLLIFSSSYICDYVLNFLLLSISIKIKLHHFSLSLFSPSCYVPPPLTLMASFLWLLLLHVCIYIYGCINVLILPAESVSVVCVYMPSGLTFLYWFLLLFYQICTWILLEESHGSRQFVSKNAPVILSLFSVPFSTSQVQEHNYFSLFFPDLHIIKWHLMPQ